MQWSPFHWSSLWIPGKKAWIFWIFWLKLCCRYHLFFRQEEQNIHPENQEHVRAVRQQLQTEQVTSAVPVPKNKWCNIQVCQEWLVCLSVCLSGSGWNLSGGGQAAILHRHVVSSVFAAGRPSRWNQLWTPVLRWESPANNDACRVTLSSSSFVFLKCYKSFNFKNNFIS